MAEELSFEDELNRAANADPFVPFTLVMASGDRYDVGDPNLIAFGGDVIVVLRPKVGSARLSFYNVSSIEIHEPAR